MYCTYYIIITLLIEFNGFNDCVFGMLDSDLYVIGRQTIELMNVFIFCFLKQLFYCPKRTFNCIELRFFF